MGNIKLLCQKFKIMLFWGNYRTRVTDFQNLKINPHSFLLKIFLKKNQAYNAMMSVRNCPEVLQSAKFCNSLLIQI